MIRMHKIRIKQKKKKAGCRADIANERTNMSDAFADIANKGMLNGVINY